MGDLVLAIGFLIMSVVVYTEASKLPSLKDEVLGPAMYPKIIVAVIAILSVVLIIQIILSKKKELTRVWKTGPGSLWKEYKFSILLTLMLAVYIVLIKVIGFMEATFVYLLVTQILLMKRRNRLRILSSIVISLLLSFGLYYFFHYYMNVYFPESYFQLLPF